MRRYEEPICEDCQHCVPIGDGDHECDADIPKIVMEDYFPAEDYGWCNGRDFIRR